MDDAAAVRRAASGAIGSVEPEPLRETLLASLEDCSPAPGAVVLASARSIDGSTEFEALADRAAGVQLVYAGLRVTRRLAGEAPWTSGGGEGANMDVLAADILVARGAFLLAGTEASDAAVDVIRAFGRDQTERERASPEDHALESDVFELAAVAGSTAVGSGAPPGLLEWASDLTTAIDGAGVPEPATLLATDPPTGPRPVADEGTTTDDGRVTSSGDR